MTRAISFATVAVLSSCALFACSKGKAPTKAPEPVAAAIDVRLGNVERRPMPNVVTLLGNVVADQQSDVAANVAGRVLMVPIERGQAVKVGQTLVMVDSKAANLSAAAAASQAEMAETQLKQARADCERSDRLLSQGAIGQAEYDRQQSQCKAQEFQANAARSQAELSAKFAADALVRAPFSGVIGERYINAGEYVQPNTKVAAVYSLDPVRITISVPEHAVSFVRVGATVQAEVSAYPGRLFPATVQYVSPALRTAQRDLLIEAKAANPDGALRPGMFATIQASLGDEMVATVPTDAIRSEGDTHRVFLARDGRAFELVVSTGATREGRTVVYEDLTADTQVIRSPPANLRDGEPITVAAGARTPAPTGSIEG